MEHQEKGHQHFVERMQSKFGDRFTILGSFINYKTKISVRCNLCLNEWEARPDTLISGICPKCTKIKRSKSEETFKEEIIKTHGNKYTLLGQYHNNHTKVLMKCNECGHEWLVFPTNLVGKKSGCPECAKAMIGETRRLTHDEYVKELESLQPNRYTLLTQYIDAKTEILVRCNIDKYEWFSLPSNLYKGVCPKCGNKVRRTNEMFINEIREKYGDEYTAIGEFVSARRKVKIRHNICGHEWDITPDKFLKQGRRCPKCYGIPLKEQQEFENEVNEKYRDRYSVLGQYINSRTQLLVRCNRCKNEWMITPDNLLRGYGCPACNVSKGEDKIKEYLNKKNITYKFQHSFKDLYGEYGKPLRFDFAIFSSGKMKCIIEYDGKLHYELGGFQTQEKFDLQKSYDEKKNKYCEDKNIPLYRIPYWEEDNIPNILEEILKGYVVFKKTKE